MPTSSRLKNGNDNMDQYVGNSNMADTSPVPWVKPSDLDAETLITLSADLAEHRVLFESFTYYVDWIKDLTREFTHRYKDRTAEDWFAEGDYWERLEEFEDEAVEQEVKKAISGFGVHRKRECGWDIIKEGDNHDR